MEERGKSNWIVYANVFWNKATSSQGNRKKQEMFGNRQQTADTSFLYTLLWALCLTLVHKPILHWQRPHRRWKNLCKGPKCPEHWYGCYLNSHPAKKMADSVSAERSRWPSASPTHRVHTPGRKTPGTAHPSLSTGPFLAQFLLSFYQIFCTNPCILMAKKPTQ